MRSWTAIALPLHDGQSQKCRFKSARAARSARTCCILKQGECRLRSLRLFEESDAETGRRGPLGPPPRRRHCDNRSEENHRTGCARLPRRGEWEGFTEAVGCAEGRNDDGRKFGRAWQAALETGHTRECGTRKAKIEAKLERNKTMANKDLRQWRPEVGQETKPIPAMRRDR